MKRIVLFVLLPLGIVALLAACNMGLFMLVFGEDVDSRSTTVKTISAPNSLPTDTYSFIIIADPHFGASKKQKTAKFLDWFENQVKTADDAYKPRFLVNVGDTLDGGHLSEANEFNDMIANMRSIATANGLAGGFQDYSILGNHDLYNHGWDVWKDEIYPYTSYYKFTTSHFSWYFLDSGNGTLGDAQLNDFEKQLKADPNPKIVFTHYAVYAGGIFEYCIQNTIERNRCLAAFEKYNVKQVFEGHDHKPHSWGTHKFGEHAITSFLYGYAFCLVTVDENAGTVTYKEISFD